MNVSTHQAANPVFINDAHSLRVWVFENARDVVDAGQGDALVDAIVGVKHPKFGTDWSAWLAANIDDLRDLVALHDITE